MLEVYAGWTWNTEKKGFFTVFFSFCINVGTWMTGRMFLIIFVFALYLSNLILYCNELSIHIQKWHWVSVKMCTLQFVAHSESQDFQLRILKMLDEQIFSVTIWIQELVFLLVCIWIHFVFTFHNHVSLLSLHSSPPRKIICVFEKIFGEVILSFVRWIDNGLAY